MTGLLYRWPHAGRFGRVVPKTKFYEHGQVSTSVRDKFVAEVQRIVWAYKLAESTINLAGTTEVPEIQVFRIDAKHDDVSEAVLNAIDKAVKTPIIFEISRCVEGLRQARTVAAHKELGSRIPKLGTYYTGDWQPADADRHAPPTAIDLAALHTALLEPLIPLAARPGEGLSGMTARLERTRKVEREIAALERRIRSEPQLNRKVELRRTLKAKRDELANLTSPNPTPTSDTKD
ncbi:DUF4391 domain-containing protein [Saccharopolyspora gregorii]|uniref:DUF4391 domain-containing protein n=1 Tax=Saccharopolyspora gregorii TaxID=33914 RepID=A0ABP6RWG1_9PSEU